MASRQIKNGVTLAVGTALAASLLAGCAGHGMAVRSNSAESERAAATSARAAKAIANAEAAVAAKPNDVRARLLLGQAYFGNGRFASAATTFEDALKLGDTNPRTALNLALSRIGVGDQQGALMLLDEWREAIPASDLGLALSLAGEPDRGVAVLSDALRSGQNTVNVRQNLAYSYALAGRWREARVMASQDLSGDDVNNRMAEWSATIQPEQFQQRVAALLGTPVRADSGQPAALALGNVPQAEAPAQVAEAAPAPAPVAEAPQVAAASELPAAPAQSDVAASVAMPAATAELPARMPSAEASPEFHAPLAVATSAPSSAFRKAFLSQPVMKTAVSLPRHPVAMPVQHRAGTHLVQLGAFSSPQNAQRAWGIYKSRNHSLASYGVDIREAVVNGKHVWRVAVAGLGGAQAANGLCSRVKSGGGECFAYSVKTQQRGLVPAPMQHGMAGPQMARR